MTKLKKLTYGAGLPVGVVVLLVITLVIWNPKDPKFDNINPNNFGIQYKIGDKWVDSTIDATDIQEIEVVKDEDGYRIDIVLDREGKQELRDLTSQNIGKPLGLMIKDRMVSIPTVVEVVDSALLSIVTPYGTGEDLALAYENDILSEAPDPNVYYLSSSSGVSMVQYGFPADKRETKVFYHQECKPGDFCTFTCLVDKCTRPDAQTFMKKLISVSNRDGKDCYWFEGNPKPIVDGDWIYESFDSRTYGCLKPEEFKIEGVVRL